MEEQRITGVKMADLDTIAQVMGRYTEAAKCALRCCEEEEDDVEIRYYDTTMCVKRYAVLRALYSELQTADAEIYKQVYRDPEICYNGEWYTHREVTYAINKAMDECKGVL